MRDRQKYPTWVKIGLWGIATRNAALAFAGIFVINQAGLSQFLDSPLRS